MEDDRELMLTRLIEASPDKLYRAWTEPALLTQWFAPKPWTTSHAELDVRPGGATLIVMRGSDGRNSRTRARIWRSCRTGVWCSPTPTPTLGRHRRSRS